MLYLKKTRCIFSSTEHGFPYPVLELDSGLHFENVEAFSRQHFENFKRASVWKERKCGLYSDAEMLQDVVPNGEVSCGNGIAPGATEDVYFTSPSPVGPPPADTAQPYNDVPPANLHADRPGSFSFSRSQAAVNDGEDFLTPQRPDRFLAAPFTGTPGLFQPPMVSDSPYEKLKTLLKQSPLTTAPSPWASRGPPGLAGGAPPAVTPGGLPRGTPGYRTGPSRLRPLGPSRLAANSRGPAFWQPTAAETNVTQRWGLASRKGWWQGL